VKPLTPEQEVWRSEKARQFLEDEMIKEALDAIRDKIIQQWADTPIKDTEMREKIWMMFNIHKNFIERIREHIETGKLASLQLKQGKRFGVF